MEDIIERIKGLRYVHVPQASQLFEEAIAEIELLRGYRDEAESDAAIARLALEKVRLTVEEQEAVQRAIDTLNAVQDTAPSATAADAMAAWRLGQLLKRLA